MEDASFMMPSLNIMSKKSAQLHDLHLVCSITVASFKSMHADEKRNRRLFLHMNRSNSGNSGIIDNCLPGIELRFGTQADHEVKFICHMNPASGRIYTI